MLVGLGTGSTVAFLLPALAERGLDLHCVATSPATATAAAALGLRVEPFIGVDALPRLDVAIDGADQVAPSGWLVKGGGAAHTREKAVAAAADRFVVIVSSDKLVDLLTPPGPARASRFRARGNTPSSRGGPAPRRPAESRRRHHRRLHGRHRRSRSAREPALGDGRRRRARALPGGHGRRRRGRPRRERRDSQRALGVRRPAQLPGRRRSTHGTPRRGRLGSSDRLRGAGEAPRPCPRP